MNWEQAIDFAFAEMIPQEFRQLAHELFENKRNCIIIFALGLYEEGLYFSEWKDATNVVSVNADAWHLERMSPIGMDVMTRYVNQLVEMNIVVKEDKKYKLTKEGILLREIFITTIAIFGDSKQRKKNG